MVDVQKLMRNPIFGTLNYFFNGIRFFRPKLSLLVRNNFVPNYHEYKNGVFCVYNDVFYHQKIFWPKCLFLSRRRFCWSDQKL